MEDFSHPSTAPRQLSPLTQKSLGNAGGLWVPFAMVGVMLLGIGALVVTLKQLLGAGLDATAIKVAAGAGIIGLAVVMVVGVRRLEKHRATKALARLESLPFSFNLEGYLVALGAARETARPTATMAFASEVALKDREKVETTLAEAKVTGQWRGNELVVVGPLVEARFRSNQEGSSARYHSNARIHAWVTSLLDDCVMRIHERQALRSLRVTIGS
jgi:hypothetical protein